MPDAFSMEDNLDKIETDKLVNSNDFIPSVSNQFKDRPGFSCDPVGEKDLIICKNITSNKVNIVLRDNINIIADYTINCLEGIVQGTINSNNQLAYKEIINKTIISSCSLPNEKLNLNFSIDMPDSTNEDAQLVCNNKSISFEESNLDICKAHDDDDNFLIRMKDKNKVLAQITGNCINTDLQDKFFNEDAKYSKTIDFFNENILPGTVDRICDIEPKSNFQKNKNKFYTFSKYSSKAYLEMAFSRFNNDDYLGALKEVNRAIEINPTDPKSFDLRGLIKFKMGFIDEALENFNKAIYLNPNKKDYYLNRANVFKIKNQYIELLNDYNKIVSLDPTSYQIILEKGILNIKVRNYDNALSDLNKYILQRDDNPKAYRYRGILYLNSGNFDLACKDLNNALKLGDEKTLGLFNFLKLKKSKACNFNIKDISNLTISEDLNSSKNILLEELCGKNTYVKVDSISSCFD